MRYIFTISMPYSISQNISSPFQKEAKKKPLLLKHKIYLSSSPTIHSLLAKNREAGADLRRNNSGSKSGELASSLTREATD